MRMFAALLLSLVLAVASVSMAVARGQAPMGGTMELCSEGGAVTVMMDASGAPVPMAPHLCPDCLSAATALDLTVPLVLAAPDRIARPVARAPLHTARHVATPLTFHARGPPPCSV